MAKVFLAEKDEGMRHLLKIWLAMRKHEVVLETTTLEEALKTVDLAVAKGVELAVVGGTWAREDDGVAIAKALKNKAPAIKVVSYLTRDIPFGDANLAGSGIDMFEQALGKLGF